MDAKVPLHELQRNVQSYLLGEHSEIVADIVDAPPLPAADRLAIYRNAYQVRLIDALNETYPVLHGLLGDEMWVALGENYVAQHPSCYRSIRWYGGELADFLTRSAPFSDEPILAEVALLEWTLAEVFDARDAESLSRAALSTIEPTRWSDLKFEFHPSLRRLEFYWNTAAVWKAMSHDETPPRPAREDAPVPWLLWRQDLQNYFRSLTVAESTALDAALSGSSFGEICEALSAVLSADEIPPAAASFLGSWADSGIIFGLR
jgi:hypothetical protein